MGAYGPMFSAVKFGDAMNKGLTLRMNQCPVKRQWPRLFEHVRNGYLKPSDIVTHRIPLEHIAEGYHIFSAKLDGCIKPLDRPERRLRRRPTMAVHRREAAAAPSRPSSSAPASPAGASTSTRRTGPSVPQERFDPTRPARTGTSPSASRRTWPRERSIEHEFLTPVFGTSLPAEGPLRGDPQARLRAVQRGPRRALAAAARRRPGGRRRRATCGRSPRCARTTRSPRPACSASSRTTRSRPAFGQKRADLVHQPLDPVIVAGPWVGGRRRGVRRRTPDRSRSAPPERRPEPVEGPGRAGHMAPLDGRGRSAQSARRCATSGHRNGSFPASPTVFR